MKRWIIVCICLFWMSGCQNLLGTSSFDVKTYTQSYLDMIYHDDLSKIQQFADISEKDVDHMRETMIDSYVTAFQDLTEKVYREDEFKQMIKDFFNQTKYTVESTTKVDDGYMIHITIEPLYVLEDFPSVFQDNLNQDVQIEEEIDSMTSSEDMTKKIYDAILQTKQHTHYGQQLSVDLHLLHQNGEYTLESSSLLEFEQKLINWGIFEGKEEN